MNKLFVGSTLALSLWSAGMVLADDADIYAIQFSEDGKHLVTGGTGGELAGPKEKFSGGIKVWSAENGTLLQAMGQSDDLVTVFGTDHGRIGKRRWGISNFKDVVMHGSYPQGKVLLLPNSLGQMKDNEVVQAPSFIGGAMDFDAQTAQRIEIGPVAANSGCDDNPYMYDYVGPIVPSDNGRYAAIVVNSCHAKSGAQQADQGQSYEYRSSLHVMELGSQKVVASHKHIDHGVYALGISNTGDQVAFVGRDRFAVVDTDRGSIKTVEEYPRSNFVIPRQFSKLNFSKDGSKLVSLRFIYDIETGTEQPMNWMNSDAKKPKRISSVAFAPDLSYFVMVQKKRSLIMFGEDGLPRSYGKADRVVLMDTKTGGETELEITDSMTEGKRCVADVSPDSERVAVACKGGVMRMFNARNGELLWSKRNVSYKAQDLSKHLIQAWNEHTDDNVAWLYSAAEVMEYSVN